MKKVYLFSLLFLLVSILHAQLSIPNFSHDGGYYNASFQLNISSSEEGGTIYFRTDGGDPREDGGGVEAEAVAYSNGITINTTATVKARIKSGNTWSVLQEGTVSKAPRNVILSDSERSCKSKSPLFFYVLQNESNIIFISNHLYRLAKIYME